MLAHAQSVTPYTNTLQALDIWPALSVCAEGKKTFNLPPIHAGEEWPFNNFSLKVQAIVGMLKVLKGDDTEELHSGSNVKHLLKHLPCAQQAQFRRHHLKRNPDKTKFSLLEVEDWLHLEANCMEFDSTDDTRATKLDQGAAIWGKTNHKKLSYGIEQWQAIEPITKSRVIHLNVSSKHKAICPHCRAEHYLSQCTTFIALTKQQVVGWIK